LSLQDCQKIHRTGKQSQINGKEKEKKKKKGGGEEHERETRRMTRKRGKKVKGSERKKNKIMIDV
jgi:hypothetical protein